MSERPPPLPHRQAVAAARAHPHVRKLATVSAEVAARFADARARHAAAADIEEIAAAAGLERTDAQTDYGNVLSILERGAEDPAERAIVAAFVGAGVARALEKDRSLAGKWSARLVYLAAHVGFDPLSALPTDLSSAARRALYRALAELARQMASGHVAHTDRAELLVACAALADGVEQASDDADFAQIVSRLSADLPDHLAARLITAPAADAPSTVLQSGPSSSVLVGQWGAVPRSPVVTVLLGLCGWLALRSLAVVLARYVLGLKRQVQLEVLPTGVTIKGKIELLGRPMREIHALLPFEGLILVRRDVRYPLLPVYVGLLSLLLGAYFGVTFFSWGVAALSPKLMGYGLLTLFAGVALDLALTTLVPALQGRCRTVLVPRRGVPVCITDLELAAADRFVADIARRAT